MSRPADQTCFALSGNAPRNSRHGRSAHDRPVPSDCCRPGQSGTDQHRPSPGNFAQFQVSRPHPGRPEFLPCRGTEPEGRAILATSLTVSRVVPGMSVTIARSCARSRLKRLLFPTFGRPTIASVKPLCTRRPYAKALHQPVSALTHQCDSPQNLLCGSDINIVLGKIDTRFQQRYQFEQLFF